MTQQDPAPNSSHPTPEESQKTAQPERSGADELQAQLAEEKNRYLYLFAEFENFKKRAIKERSEAVKFAVEPLARELLLVLDNFERALAHMNPDTDRNLAEGLKLILTQLQQALEKQGIAPVGAEGLPFDPNVHEAVAQEPSQEIPQGQVLRENLKGYMLHGRLLRPAQVVVSAGPAGG